MSVTVATISDFIPPAPPLSRPDPPRSASCTAPSCGAWSALRKTTAVTKCTPRLARAVWQPCDYSGDLHADVFVWFSDLSPRSYHLSPPPHNYDVSSPTALAPGGIFGSRGCLVCCFCGVLHGPGGLSSSLNRWRLPISREVNVPTQRGTIRTNHKKGGRDEEHRPGVGSLPIGGRITAE
jgi:hypothetical protein